MIQIASDRVNRPLYRAIVQTIANIAAWLSKHSLSIFLIGSTLHPVLVKYFFFLKLWELETYKFLTVFWYFTTVDMFGARYNVSLQLNL